MTELPRRKHFQIHLSTAIVIAFVAGVVIWANTRDRLLEKYCDFWMKHGFAAEAYGWPERAFYKLNSIRPADGGSTERQVVYMNVAIDAALAIAMLIATWFLCERLIRRRAARKEH